MKDHQFNVMEEQQQTIPIWEKGVLVAERIEGFHKFMLYQVEDFYVEVTHHTHFNVIIRVTSFSDTKQLDLYIDSVNIDMLVSLC
jgi:hypothetical protein